jgi:hypothetical protein
VHTRPQGGAAPSAAISLMNLANKLNASFGPCIQVIAAFCQAGSTCRQTSAIRQRNVCKPWRRGSCGIGAAAARQPAAYTLLTRFCICLGCVAWRDAHMLGTRQYPGTVISKIISCLLSRSCRLPNRRCALRTSITIMMARRCLLMLTAMLAACAAADARSVSLAWRMRNSRSPYKPSEEAKYNCKCNLSQL